MHFLINLNVSHRKKIMKNFVIGQNLSFSKKTGIVLAIMLMAGCSSLSSPEIWAEGKPKHHTQNGFRNYPVIPDFAPVDAAFYFRRVMDFFFLPDVPANHYLSEKDAISQYQQLNGRDSITWLGHATFLIRVNGKTILTDPFLTKYSSPYWDFGPRRYVQPGISLKNLPSIDMVVVSHNHPDHLDAGTVESLQGKERINVFVPLGLKTFFKDIGYKNIQELDWNEGFSYDGIELLALPAVHFSGRGMNDKNKTLWCSWSISSRSKKIYFSGDTSYSPTMFKTIGKENGPYDIAIISIGTYKTREYGPSSHLTPEEAIKVVLETKGTVAVAMHWGTIQLSDEPPWEPPVRFRKAAQANGFSAEKTWVMKIGETRFLPSK